MIRTVACAVSGGVDSAVAAFLLKRRGFQVHAVFMDNWDLLDDTISHQCAQLSVDYADAVWVAKKLGIPFHNANFVRDYWHNVFVPTVSAYEAGKSANPDILCNREVKFGVFYEWAIKTLSVDAIATGHYAGNSFGTYLQDYCANKPARLLQSKDKYKDQTFFLCLTPQEALRRCMFPLARFTKGEVKQIARDIGLSRLCLKPSSAGICFINPKRFDRFIDGFIEERKGEIRDFETGVFLRFHNGVHHFTIGQRVGGLSKKYVVARVNHETQLILACLGSDHPVLFSDEFECARPHWISGVCPLVETEEISLNCFFRFQHTKPLTECCIMLGNDGRLLVKLMEPQRAITVGQFAVFYTGDECLGGAEIVKVGLSFHELGRKIQVLS